MNGNKAMEEFLTRAGCSQESQDTLIGKLLIDNFLE